jgi:hypothetical protein
MGRKYWFTMGRRKPRWYWHRGQRRRQRVDTGPAAAQAWTRASSPWPTYPGSIVTVFDFTNCYAAPPVALPCERVAYRFGALNAVLNGWCGLLLIAVAAWLVWDLWSAAAPRPITDDFLKLLEDSFARDWRKPRTWPWTRVAWAYGFALVGVTSGVGMLLLISARWNLEF